MPEGLCGALQIASDFEILKHDIIYQVEQAKMGTDEYAESKINDIP